MLVFLVPCLYVFKDKRCSVLCQTSLQHPQINESPLMSAAPVIRFLPLFRRDNKSSTDILYNASRYSKRFLLISTFISASIELLLF